MLPAPLSIQSICPCCLLSFHTFPCTISPLFCLLLSPAGHVKLVQCLVSAAQERVHVWIVTGFVMYGMAAAPCYTGHTMTHHYTPSLTMTPVHTMIPLHTTHHDTPYQYTMTYQYTPQGRDPSESKKSTLVVRTGLLHVTAL